MGIEEFTLGVKTYVADGYDPADPIFFEALQQDVFIDVSHPEEVPSRRLGLWGVDLGELDPVFAELIKMGGAVEAQRGATGFDPNTYAFLWSDQGLSMNGLLRVLINNESWSRKKAR